MATRNVRWLLHLLEWQLKEATGLPVSTALVESMGGGVNIAELYRCLGAPFSSFSWAQLFHTDSPPEGLLDYLAPYFIDRLVIGMELSPFMIAALQKLGVVYVDFTHSPIRFLPDYHLCLRSNSAEVRNRAEQYGVSPAELFIGAGARKAQGYRRTRTLVLEPNAALFCGQMPVDSSLITRQGELARDEDVLRSLITLSREHGTVYYKRHPHVRKDAPLLRKLNDVRRVELIDVNFYDLMSRPEILKVAALTSGTTREAHFFGKDAARFLDVPDYFSISGSEGDHAVDASLRYQLVRNECLHPRFWVDVLEPVLPIDERAKRHEFDWLGKNYISASLNMRWG